MGSRPRLVIGCPIRKREWIVDVWRKHALVAAERAGFADPTFVFVQGSDEDKIDWHDCVVTTIEEDPREDVRRWGTDRFMHMVKVRNQLLQSVRGLRPDLFLSCDSDILLHEDALTGMVEVLGRSPDVWGVGGKAYMTATGKAYPSYGKWMSRRDVELGFKREESSAVFKVDVVMAVVLMGPYAYNVDYTFHHWGEDAGWSAKVGTRGGELWWDGRYANKHVLEPALLNEVDRRVGF
jgi:hypothetical protein